MPTPRPHTHTARLVWTVPVTWPLVPRAEPTDSSLPPPRSPRLTLAATRPVDSGRHTVTRVCHHGVTRGDGGQDRA